MVAVQEPSYTSLRDLLAGGANLDAQGPTGRTALMYATMQEDPIAMKMLLDRGASTKPADADGKTALYVAIEEACKLQHSYTVEETGWQNWLRTIRILVAGGADPTQKAHDGSSARDLVARLKEIKWPRVVEAARELRKTLLRRQKSAPHTVIPSKL